MPKTETLEVRLLQGIFTVNLIMVSEFIGFYRLRRFSAPVFSTKREGGISLFLSAIHKLITNGILAQRKVGNYRKLGQNNGLIFKDRVPSSR